MSKEQARQEFIDMFMEEITRLRKKIEELEEERDEYKYQWERCRRGADELEARIEQMWREKELAKIRRQ